MYRLIYHGPDKAEYCRIRNQLPGHFKLSLSYSRSRLVRDLTTFKPHGLILPLLSPKPDDLNFLRQLVAAPEIPGVVVTSGKISPQQAVCCMRLGAYDCLTGPTNGEVLGMVFDRMLTERKIYSAAETDSCWRIIGNSRPIADMLIRLSQYADLDHPVLITGETGAGKELAARAIHQNSRRRNRGFTAVNCSTYSDELLGSELFGSRNGAFTGSVDRPGLFEQNRGGTLFLDEIGELSIQGQACLLRVLEEKTIRRMGSLGSIPVDVRVIAATNRPLRQMLKEKRFRSDLFYRLNLLGLTVPPLRKRKSDIPAIARHYLSVECGACGIDSGAVALLAHHDWPGNIREMQSVLLKASLSATGRMIRAGNIQIG